MEIKQIVERIERLWREDEEQQQDGLVDGFKTGF